MCLCCVDIFIGLVSIFSLWDLSFIFSYIIFICLSLVLICYWVWFASISLSIRLELLRMRRFYIGVICSFIFLWLSLLISGPQKVEIEKQVIYFIYLC